MANTTVALIVKGNDPRDPGLRSTTRSKCADRPHKDMNCCGRPMLLAGALFVLFIWTLPGCYAACPNTTDGSADCGQDVQEANDVISGVNMTSSNPMDTTAAAFNGSTGTQNATVMGGSSTTPALTNYRHRKVTVEPTTYENPYNERSQARFNMIVGLVVPLSFALTILAFVIFVVKIGSALKMDDRCKRLYNWVSDKCEYEYHVPREQYGPPIVHIGHM